jgi:foldase protein PrsA
METTQNTAPEISPASPKKFDAKRFLSYKVLALLLVSIILAGMLYYFKAAFIAATVDGRPISRLAVIGELEKQSGREALDALISERLINNEADRQNITVSDEEVANQLKKVEDQIVRQGGTLEEALEQQGVTHEDLRTQVILQKKAEKILADKLTVTDEEVDQYIAGSGQPLEAGREEEQKEEVREGLRQQKFSEEISTWLDEARTRASIREFVSY